MKEEKGYLITKMKELISKIIGFSEKDLIGVSKTQYEQECKTVTS
jgi:hypothetical protein